ncbi:hypothetical protein MKW92_012913 [Papaver armeniacum]|nr:hypothetical protein MKW92_012913 [Papaver armeniacum]
MCTDLRNLYLQGNRISGEIPDFLFKLPNLVRLNLAGNNFSGEISPSFNNLTRLGTLYLEGNELTGSIPELNLPDLVQFNVSNNQLNGPIPKKLRTMKASSFSGNSLCGGPMGRCPGEQVEGEPKKKKKLSAGAIAGIVIGSIVVFLLILLILFFLCRKKSGGKTRAVDVSTAKNPNEVEMGGDKGIGEDNGNGNHGAGNAAAAVGAGTLAASAVASKDVNSGLGMKKLIFFEMHKEKGTFGTAYKAVLEVGTIVAVKRLKDVTISEKEFREKIETVGSMQNESLVPLRAYYYSGDEKLLVYDYMSMGSLSALLHGNRGSGRTPLNWETRSGIALGAARGIAYLHSQGSHISHGNIKSSNILLTKTYEARVSDFGLAQLVGPNATPNRVAGYRAPEVTDPRRVSQKADVYSFGVLLLELLTGKAPTHALLNEEGVDLPRWVQSVVREEWTAEVFDLELLRYQNVEEEMVQLLQLAIDCAAQYPDKRPTMAEVTKRIEELRPTREQDPSSDLVEGEDGSSQQTSSVG